MNDLSKIKTNDLVKELKKRDFIDLIKELKERDGVTYYDVEPYEVYELQINHIGDKEGGGRKIHDVDDGPKTIFVVID